MSRGCKKYYVTLFDDDSCYTMVYLLNSKDEKEEMFIKYQTEDENKLDKIIKRLRSDKGGEYNLTRFKNYYGTNGIIHEGTAPYAPEQNVAAERKNRTVKILMLC